MAHPALVLQSPALPLLLQHSTVHTDLQTVLQLCCTSKAMRAAVLQHCRGLLDVSFAINSRQHTQRFAAWVGKCGQLLGALRMLPGHHHKEPFMYELGIQVAAEQLEEAELCIAAALMQLQLQDEGGGVQLRQLQLQPVGSALQALLQAIPDTMLLQLHLSHAAPHLLPSFSSGIAALRQLQALTLEPRISAQHLLQLLQPLTALTLLVINTSMSAQTSAEAVAQLQRQLSAHLKVLKL